MQVLIWFFKLPSFQYMLRHVWEGDSAKESSVTLSSLDFSPENKQKSLTPEVASVRFH